MRAKNRTEAQRALGELASDLRRKGTGTTDRTLRETCEAWAEHAKPSLSPNTARELTGSLERYVYPSPLAARPLAKVKAVDLDTLYRGLQEHGGKVGGPLKPATVRKVHTALSLVFAQAVRWEWLAQPRRRRVISEGVRRRARAAVGSPSPQAHRGGGGGGRGRGRSAVGGVPALMVATTGRRRGELCGLRWTEVDLERGTAAIFRVVKIAAGNKLVIAAFPKSARGEATIALDEGTVRALGSLRAWQDERAASFDAALVLEAYVFSPEIDGGRPLHPQVVTHRFGRLRRRLGTTGVRLHDLRHFTATQLLGAGYSVTAVAGRLGNSPAVLLGRYAHWVRVQDEDQATHMGKLVGMGVEAE